MGMIGYVEVEEYEFWFCRNEFSLFIDAYLGKEFFLQKYLQLSNYIMTN